MPGLKQRAKTLEELAANCAYLFAPRPLTMDEKAKELVATADAGVIETTLAKLSSLPEWTPEALENAVREVSEDLGLKLGKVAQPLRAALTGRATSPGLFDVLNVLGRQESLGRLQDIIET